MIFSLDSNVMIDICNGRDGVRQRFDEAVNDGGKIVASPVASHELLFGCLITVYGHSIISTGLRPCSPIC